MGHLKDENVTYLRHWLFAFQFGVVMILVGVAVIIHAFIPCLFKNTGSDAITAMYKMLRDEGD